MRKLGILIILTFLLSGCTLDYKFIIDENLIIKEEITVYEKNSKMTEFTININAYIDETLSEYLSDPKYSNYVFSKNVGNTYSSGIAKATYLDFNNFKNTNVIKSLFFEDVFMVKTENIVKINFISNTENMLLKETFIENPIINNANITIIVPFVVTESNADEVDKENNAYTWKYNKDVQYKNISLTFDTSKKEVYRKDQNMLYILGGIILIVIGIVVYIYYKYKKNSNL